MITAERNNQPTQGTLQKSLRCATQNGRTLQVLLAACLFSVLLAPAASATQREVGGAQAYATMQACMNAAVTGDICNVHAGTYTENVAFKTSGVTLQANSGDTVIVKGTIDIASNANSIVDGFQVTGFSVTSNGGIHAYNTTGGIVRNNVVHDASGSGIYTRLVTNFQITGNTVHDMAGPCCISDGDGIVAYSTNSTDGTPAHGVRISNNEVYQNHQDGIELNGNYASVFNNYVHDNIYSDWASTHPDGIECNGIADNFTGCSHDFVYGNVVKNQDQNIYFYGNGSPSQNADIWIFNNVIFNDPTSSTGVNMLTASASQIILGIGDKAYILNNTIGGTVQYFDILLGDGSGGTDGTQAFTNVTVENNIITNSPYVGFWTYPASNVVAMNGNLYYNNSSAMVHWGSSGNLNSIAAVRSATGMEANGQSANPLVAAFPTPTLGSGSPAIGAGVNLTNLGQTFLNSDKNGTPRPGSGGWDVGAYSSGSAVTRPNPPTNVKATAQ
jgi:parallel beta-helix repeat protein